MAQVLGEIDNGHATAPDLTLDAMAISQCLLESARRFGHPVSEVCTA
jgi:hypothetical protein